MKKHVTVNDWVGMFQEIGLSHDQMKQWHKVFEIRHPAGHESFLVWLGLPPKEVERIRLESR